MGFFESQIKVRARLDTELTERAYADLGNSVQSSQRGVTHSSIDSDEVDAAAYICFDYLRVTHGTVPEGITDLDERLEYLCRPSGTMRRQIKLDEGWQSNAFGAMLATLDTGEVVALIPTKTGFYQMVNAAGNTRRVNREVAKHIGDSATLFYRPFPNKKLKVRDLIWYMVETLEPIDCVRILVTAIVATLVGMLPTWANNIVFTTVVPSENLHYVGPIACLLVGVAISKVLVDTMNGFAMSRLITKINLMCEAATYARVLMLPPSFFKQYESGSLAARVQNVTVLTQLIVSLVFGSGLTSLLSFVYLFQIWMYAPQLAIPAFVTVVAQIVISFIGTLATLRYDRAAQQANAELSGTVTSILNGVSKVKLAGAERRAFARWAKGYSAYANASYNRPLFVIATSAFTMLASALGTAVIYLSAGESGLSVADYMSFNVAYGMMLAAVASMANMASEIAQIGPIIELVEPVLSTEPEVADDKPVVSKLSGAIEVSGLTFRYKEGSPYILHNLSFHIKSGEYVAIVGKSGCGKSTLVRLLLGFEQANRGSIFYGPYDVGKVDLRSLRRSIGTVTQDGRLLSGSIASNITISMPLATLDDAWKAAEIAGVADEIRKMPMEMQTIISEGTGGISGGQRQRIMIARAVCGNRKILILDEATSALDNVTQRQVAESLSNLGCTRIVIAHRLSTVKKCDRILVLDGGRIAEEGTYDELIARDGLFAELVSRQQIDGA